METFPKRLIFSSSHKHHEFVIPHFNNYGWLLKDIAHKLITCR